MHHPVYVYTYNIIIRLKRKINSSSSKISWPKLLNEVLNLYNSTPHSITKFSPSYSLLGYLPYDPLTTINNYYPPVDEVCKLAKERTIQYHNENKVRYDARFLPVKLKLVI